MWQLYTEIQKDEYAKAVVIKSSINNLNKFLKPLIEPYNLEVEPVDYLASYASEDYSDTSNSTFFKKRKCFQHENEVRAVFGYKRFTQSHENDENLFFPIDISKFIEEIRISPFLGQEFISEIKSLLEKYKINIPVNQSEILIQPDISITETLNSVTRENTNMGDVAQKIIKFVDNETIVITERFDNTKKEYTVKLKKR